MSTKGIIFKEISNHLKAKVTELQFVDKDRGQLSDVNNYMFPRPAVFLSFGNAEYITMTDGRQKGTCVLRVKTVYENYSESFTGSVDQDLALNFFEFNELVHQTLEGLQGTYFNNTTRIADEDDDDHKNLIVTNMEYQFTMYDPSTAHLKGYQCLAEDPELKVNATLSKNNISTQGIEGVESGYLPIIPN